MAGKKKPKEKIEKNINMKINFWQLLKILRIFVYAHWIKSLKQFCRNHLISQFV